MLQEYSNRNLRHASFKNADLSNAHFSGTDLRGTDFSGSNLTGADFNNVKTGITPENIVIIFFVTLVISALSGYIAMLAGQTVQLMLASEDSKIQTAGMVSTAVTLFFIIYSYLKGIGHAIRQLLIPTCIVALIIGFTAYVSGYGSGMGMVYLVLSNLLVAVMFIIGTVARATAGTLSNVLFIVVALAGGLFAKSVGGGVGTAIMAVSCALVSKRALSGAKGFESLRKVALYITKKFGTSFRHSNLAGANFSHSKIRNADFTDADVSSVSWGDSKKYNCIEIK